MILRGIMSTLNYATHVGQWLDGVAEWDYWLTITFRYAPSLPSVRRSMERFSDQVNPSLFFWGSESGPCTGRNHVHGLLHFDQSKLNFPPTPSAVWNVAFQRFGRTHVDKFDPQKGATHYVAKYVSKTISDWDVITRHT